MVMQLLWSPNLRWIQLLSVTWSTFAALLGEQEVQVCLRCLLDSVLPPLLCVFGRSCWLDVKRATVQLVQQEEPRVSAESITFYPLPDGYQMFFKPTALSAPSSCLSLRVSVPLQSPLFLGSHPSRDCSFPPRLIIITPPQMNSLPPPSRSWNCSWHLIVLQIINN